MAISTANLYRICVFALVALAEALYILADEDEGGEKERKSHKFFLGSFASEKKLTTLDDKIIWSSISSFSLHLVQIQELHKKKPNSS